VPLKGGLLEPWRHESFFTSLTFSLITASKDKDIFTNTTTIIVLFHVYKHNFLHRSMFNNYLRLSTLSAQILNCCVSLLPGYIFKPTDKEAIDSLLIHSIISSGTPTFFLSTRKASDNASEMVTIPDF
jgi:hypothetical protein